jgi:hypothetical protein
MHPKFGSQATKSKDPVITAFDFASKPFTTTALLR